MPVPVLVRRAAAGAALVALPLAAVAGCGEAAQTKRASVQESLQKAQDNLAGSGAASLALRITDPAGALKKAAPDGSEGLTPAQSDVLLGGTITMTVDPAAGKTMRDLQQADPAMPLVDQLKLVNVAIAVQADGGPLLQVRLVGGDLYANVGLDRLVQVVTQADPSSDLAAQVEGLQQQAPPELAPLVADVRAGKWLKVPVAQYADQLEQLTREGGATPTPSVDTRRLGTDLLAAVRPFTAVTDAGGEGGTRVVDVKVQAKQALKAALGVLRSAPVPGLADLDTSSLDRLTDATADGQVTLVDDHLTKAVLDLQSLVRVAPASSANPDLTGAQLVAEVDDSAEEVAVPQDVSSFDVGALIEQVLSAAGPGTLPS